MFVINPPVNVRLFIDDYVLFKEILSPGDQLLLNSNPSDMLVRNLGYEVKSWKKKTICLPITTKKNSFQFQYNLKTNLPVIQVEKCKYLGLTMSKNLDWSTHINNSSLAAFIQLGFLRHKLKRALPPIKLLAYSFLVRPKMKYGNIAWDPYTKHNSAQLEKVRRQSCRVYLCKLS